MVVVDADAAGLAREHVGPGTEVVSGARRDGLPLPHAGRAKLVVEAAKAGHRVVRLLAGDPVIRRLGRDRGRRRGEGTGAVRGRSRRLAAHRLAAYAGAGLVGGKAREVRVVDIDDPGVDWAATPTRG